MGALLLLMVAAVHHRRIGAEISPTRELTFTEVMVGIVLLVLFFLVGMAFIWWCATPLAHP